MKLIFPVTVKMPDGSEATILEQIEPPEPAPMELPLPVSYRLRTAGGEEIWVSYVLLCTRRLDGRADYSFQESGERFPLPTDQAGKQTEGAP